MKILVIQQKMIGDVLTSTILFEALKEKYPEAELHYLINSHTVSVVENNPFIDDYIVFTPEIEKQYLKFWGLIKSIRSNKYDVVIDAYSKLSSNILSGFSKAKTKISYRKKYRSFIYDYNIVRKKHTKLAKGIEIDNRLKLLKPLGISTKNIKPKIYLTNKELKNSKLYLENNGINTNAKLFMISVLGSSNSKTYPLPYMAQLIDAIVEATKGQLLFNYIPSQEAQAKAVFNLCKPKTQQHIRFDVFGKNLREFLAITKYCTALIGNEGGATNMAKALDVPTFSIFAPWIDKEGWNMFEDNTHVSVHLIDTKPELFTGKRLKETKGDAQPNYEAFLPEYILPTLSKYLNQF